MQVSVEGQKNLEKELASSLKREAILQNLMKELRSKLLNFQKEQALKPSDSTETLPAEVKVESDFVEKVAVDEGKSERVANLEMELQACITEIENLKDSHKKEVAELIHVGNL